MIKEILIPVDGSPSSEQAARVGLELARLLQTNVTFTNVVDQGTSFTPDERHRSKRLIGNALVEFWANKANEEATRSLAAAHAEARGALNGIGLVKLMGRESGFITAHATLADGDVNFCLVPEVPFTLEGPNGLLALLEDRLQERRHAVIAVAEGAGQELLAANAALKDASGNTKLQDIGTFLRDTISTHFKIRGFEHSIKYIDPSYSIRSQTANAIDAEYCIALGQHAVHAGMAGRTDMMVGYWNQYFTHVPIALATTERKRIDPRSELWQRVLGSTGQPALT